MACPTCNHTMETLFADDTCRRHWCPRCGTLRTVFFTLAGGDTVEDEKPDLVERCREFEVNQIPVGHTSAEAKRLAWHRLGIAESINLPGDRPQ